MGFNTIDSIDVNWEVTQKLGPMVPMDLRELTMQAFHGVGHPEAEGDHNKNKQIRRLRPLLRPAVMCSFMDWYPGMASWGQRPQIMAIPLQGCGDLKGLANHLEPKADEAIIPTSNNAKKKEENMPITLETATHV